ncbi:MAG: hypothetical protein ACLR70_01535 [Streptococcus thermophilus]
MVLFLLHPTLLQIVTTAKESGRGVCFFSIPLALTSYSSTVIPVILASLVYELRGPLCD